MIDIANGPSRGNYPPKRKRSKWTLERRTGQEDIPNANRKKWTEIDHRKIQSLIELEKGSNRSIGISGTLSASPSFSSQTSGRAAAFPLSAGRNAAEAAARQWSKILLKRQRRGAGLSADRLPPFWVVVRSDDANRNRTRRSFPLSFSFPRERSRGRKKRREQKRSSARSPDSLAGRLIGRRNRAKALADPAVAGNLYRGSRAPPR
ncbi:hypothetical protein GUJ93_ZPchr0002g26435 [Zizania palustris]|uniref:Uncharacterized protein n=1 Tax=Zizania palustris TaxID=103762 RepID=A0A8J5RWS0_ZIZPA|nr:hypothetical protein GUJ93_ZPchr0002g26435 [Zizania palustris]